MGNRALSAKGEVKWTPSILTQSALRAGELENFTWRNSTFGRTTDMTTTQPYTSGATRAAHRLSEKLAADLKRLGPLRDTLGRQQVRREQRKAAKKGAKR